jgi:sensor histidine kinase regulating citrate/malate metabolism
VIESLESGLVVLSDRNIVIDMNQTARRFTTAKMGQPFPIEECLECMDPRDAENFLYVYTNKPKSSIQAELSSFIPTMQHVLMRIHPIVHRNQRFLGRIITFQDVTEWRSLVDELNSKNQDLQNRNEELTQIQEELYDANKKLELLATTDSLTGCYNRRYLMQMME